MNQNNGQVLTKKSNWKKSKSNLVLTANQTRSSTTRLLSRIWSFTTISWPGYSHSVSMLSINKYAWTLSKPIGMTPQEHWPITCWAENINLKTSLRLINGAFWTLNNRIGHFWGPRDFHFRTYLRRRPLEIRGTPMKNGYRDVDANLLTDNPSEGHVTV